MAAELQAKKSQSQNTLSNLETISTEKITQEKIEIPSTQSVEELRSEIRSEEIIPKAKKLFLGSGKDIIADPREAKPKSAEKK